MYSYALLEPGCYYIIQQKEDGPLGLIKINLVSDHCVFVSRYDETEVMEWKKKTDSIADIIELLGDEQVKAWEKTYFNNQDQDTINYEEDEE
jgi:hypothetical protein